MPFDCTSSCSLLFSYFFSVFIYSVGRGNIFLSPSQRTAKEDRRFKVLMNSTVSFQMTTRSYDTRVDEPERRGLDDNNRQDVTTIVNMEAITWFNGSKSHGTRLSLNYEQYKEITISAFNNK